LQEANTAAVAAKDQIIAAKERDLRAAQVNTVVLKFTPRVVFA
jgi:hypothetical protein